ncbi:MAG: RsmE family RNA methyltransferase [Kiritimatiellia bacterium]
MHRCFINTDRLHNDLIPLGRDECRHLKNVLRIQPNDEIELFDGAGFTRQAVIQSVEKNSILIRPSADPVKHPEPQCSITLFCCISKGKRMDWAVEKAAELGTTNIVPVISARTIVRLSNQDRIRKAYRWRRVAIDALRQCGGSWLPDITQPLDFSDALKLIYASSPVFTAALSDDAINLRDAIQQIETAPARVSWFVGPEGDFTAEELDMLRDADSVLVSLGKNILRAETAAVYGLCVLGCAFNR